MVSFKPEMVTVCVCRSFKPANATVCVCHSSKSAVVTVPSLRMSQSVFVTVPILRWSQPFQACERHSLCLSQVQACDALDRFDARVGRERSRAVEGLLDRLEGREGETEGRREGGSSVSAARHTSHSLACSSQRLAPLTPGGLLINSLR